jgi:hypothetical protein
MQSNDCHVTVLPTNPMSSSDHEGAKVRGTSTVPSLSHSTLTSLPSLSHQNRWWVSPRCGLPIEVVNKTGPPAPWDDCPMVGWVRIPVGI